MLSAVVALLVTVGVAVAPQKTIVVSYQDPNTPQSAVDEAMAAIKEAGGVITHEYTLFKGFAAKASEKAIEAVHALGDKYMPTIEQDITFTTQDQ